MNKSNRKNMFYILPFALLIFSIVISGCQIMPPSPVEVEWTVMVYLASDNNLEPVAIRDFNEMEMVGSSKDVNVVVQIDRIPFEVLNQIGEGIYDNDSNGNWTGTRRYYVTQDMDMESISSILKLDLGEKNMGNPQTLMSFVQWAIENYPAQKYMLVLWNHGGGFRSLTGSRDICWDVTNGDDKITMPQLEEALSFISGQLGKKIEIVGMDACFMGMLEVAYQIKDYAQILISSEASIPGDGWQYDCLLQSLVNNPGKAPDQFANDIVNCYYEQYAESGQNVTLSAFDLNRVDELSDKISTIAQAIMSDGYTNKNNYRDAGDNSQHYTGLAFEYVDLKDLMVKLPAYTLSSTVINIARQIEQLMEVGNTVISKTYSGKDVQNSYGLSIYFPYYNYDSYYDYTNFARDTLWDEMLLYLGY